jgi:hypothetical protein
VVTNRFLCHMPPAETEACLRNFAQLVKGGEYLFVSDQPTEIRPWDSRMCRKNESIGLCAASEGVASKAPRCVRAAVVAQPNERGAAWVRRA